MESTANNFGLLRIHFAVRVYIFYHFGCSFLHVYQGDFLRGSPRGCARPDEWHKPLALGEVRYAVKGFTHRDHLVFVLTTFLVAISCEHQNLTHTVAVP